MKKQFFSTSRLTFNKEKVADLSPEALDQIQGGKTNDSTCHNFTCTACTGGSSKVEDEEAN